MDTPCPGRIDLSAPIGTERRRGYQPPWYTVNIYKCPVCGRGYELRAPIPKGELVCRD